MGDNSPREDAGSAPKRQALSPADPRWKDYPLGQGPLEQLYEKCATGSIRLDLALKLAASDDIASQLSEAYAWAFGMRAARNAAANRWREGRLQSQILLAAARAAWADGASDTSSRRARGAGDGGRRPHESGGRANLQGCAVWRDLADRNPGPRRGACAVRRVLSLSWR